MRPFDYQRADALDQATQATHAGGAMAIAGGTNLIDLMKLQVETPVTLVDINALPLDAIAVDGDGLGIGALVTNTDAANDERIRRDYPLLARAILAGATQQLRNKATTGGNLCQRTRCYYFTNIDQPCNKREPGSGCGAIKGIARLHAILGTSDQCIATYPGDMAVALAALDAAVVIAAADGGERAVPVRDFHRLPGDTPERDNVLEPGDVITAVTLPAPVSGRQIYRKVCARSPRSSIWPMVASTAPTSRSAGWRTSRGTTRGSRNCWSAKSRRCRCSTRPPTCCSKTRKAMARTISRYRSHDGRWPPCCARPRGSSHERAPETRRTR